MEWYVVVLLCFGSFGIGMVLFAVFEDRLSAWYKNHYMSIINDNEQFIGKIRGELDVANKSLKEASQWEEKYKQLVGELDRLREAYDTPVPFTLVESQKGLSFSQGELKKLLRDEEGGI